LILKLVQQSGYVHFKARTPTNLGWLGPYDGNIIGGLLIGAGMTLTGSCPGTVFAQVGSGVRTGPLVLAGGILGGIFYTAVSRNLKTKEAKEANPDTLLTVSEKANLDPNLVLLLFESLCAAVVTLAATLGPEGPTGRLNPVLGGLLMGGSQLTSVLLTKSSLGISSSYEEAGKWFWKLVGSSKEQLSSRSIIFALGTTIGSFLVARTLPDLVERNGLAITPLRAIFGGAIMAFGSRLGGGCTSGHGISGMALLGVSSIISVVSMFAGGIAMAKLIS
jgi:uncharacterized membrane protein YedE/YeeE